MILKPCKQVLTYYPTPKITEYELLTKYNPLFINRKIKALQEQIDCMYSLNVSHMTCDDVMGVHTTSYPLDKLVCWIIEQKEGLEKYKVESRKRLNLVKKITKHYPLQEQKDIVLYMQSDGFEKPHETIDKLQRDLYKTHHKGRLERNRERVSANKTIYDDYLKDKRAALHNEREVLAI